MINSVDNYGFTTTILNESFNTKDKVLNYKVYINKNTSYINIVFNNNYNNNLTIKKIYINNKEYILNYKLLPTNIVIKSIILYIMTKVCLKELQCIKIV